MSIKIGLLGFGTVASGILSQMLTKSLTMKRFKSL